MSFSDLLDACAAVGDLAGDLGIGLLDAEDARLDGRHVTVGGRTLVNFTSCSALGLELDPRLIEGAVDATRRYGTQFSVSRAFLSAPPYRELEAALEQMTGGCALVTPSTSLASAAALPSLVGERDVVLLDHQVHMTVQQVMPLLQRAGVAVEFVRHGRLDRLEDRIRELRTRHHRVWFALDGVYSMHGDLAAMEGLVLLLARHPELHLYVDDAHGTSWTGLHGRGHALSHLVDRDRVVVALSLNKSFAAAGGALVLPDEASKRRVRHTSGPLLFSGPVQPPMLGAALASARIHLSSELEGLQAELRARVEATNRHARELGLPLLHGHEMVPIRFLSLGAQPASVAMAAHLIERGFLASCALFPAVPAHQTGIRFTVTRHHTLEDLRGLLDAMAAYLPEAMAQGESPRVTPGQGAPRAELAADGPAPASAALRCELHGSIDDRGSEEWDRLLGSRGFDSGTLRTYEHIFDGQKPEDAWRFHYLTVRDAAGHPLLATFLTESWMKDDMFADASLSLEVERQRRLNPSFLTSRVLSLGCPLTEGDHLYLDRRGDWQGALQLLVDRLSELAECAGVASIALRDLPPDDEPLAEALRRMGFARVATHNAYTLALDWRTREERLARLTRRARRFQRREVEPFDDEYDAHTHAAGRELPPALMAHLVALYREVWRRSLALNTFPLPDDFLPRLLAAPAEPGAAWEIVTLVRRGSPEGTLPDAFFAARRTREAYLPLVVGLDYRAVAEHGVYRQCIAHAIRRARDLGLRELRLGLGADLEKQRFGARAVPGEVWMQSRDPYHLDVLALLAGQPRPGADPGPLAEGS